MSYFRDGMQSPKKAAQEISSIVKDKESRLKELKACLNEQIEQRKRIRSAWSSGEEKSELEALENAIIYDDLEALERLSKKTNQRLERKNAQVRLESLLSLVPEEKKESEGDSEVEDDDQRKEKEEEEEEEEKEKEK
jgi:hypothetical protein